MSVRLTKSEQKVFDLKMQGRTNKEVSNLLSYPIVNGRPFAVEYLVSAAMRRAKATNAMHMGYLIGSAK